jgi:hypothetical protein
MDNDTDDDPDAIRAVLDRYRPADCPPITLAIDKHRDETRRGQSYSVNRVMGDVLVRMAAPWVFFTRADYILHKDAVRAFWSAAQAASMPRVFVTSYAYHHALDERADQRIEGFRDIEQHGWRTHEQSTDVLLQAVNGWRVDSSDKDAGVWLTRRDLWREVGGLNEQMVSWGLQQTVFQQALAEAGTRMLQLPRFYFHHQHHGGHFRSYDKAIEELEAHWGPRENLNTFRDIQGFVGAVCDELGPPKP